MKVNKSQAVWKGNLKEGSGQMSFEHSKISFPYSFKSRFADGDGANPEMLIGAAHAGCFSMAFSNMLTEEGFDPKEITTQAEVKLDSTDSGFKIISSHLTVTADIDDIDEQTFQRIAKSAKDGCPVSQALASLEITLEASLKG
ncbi:MAG: OsmC family protein [Prolixibacteraceae bacterium]